VETVRVIEAERDNNQNDQTERLHYGLRTP
jgi:hypothetical protein